MTEAREPTKATRAEAKERTTEAVPAEQDNSAYGLIGTPDQYDGADEDEDDLPFADDS